MGFRTGAYAKVWEVTPMSDTSTKVRMSVSRKNKQTGEYEQDFSGFVLCIGTAAARKAMQLHEGSRIKIGDCDVTTKYDSQKKITYTNFKKMQTVEIHRQTLPTRSQRLATVNLMITGSRFKAVCLWEKSIMHR